MNWVKRDYYDNSREIEWKKFDEETANLSLQLIEGEFSDYDRIPGGIRFGEAYVFKIVNGDDPEYRLESGESAAILEYDKSSSGYNQEFVDKFAETFSGNEEEINERVEENFNALLR